MGHLGSRLLAFTQSLLVRHVSKRRELSAGIQTPSSHTSLNTTVSFIRRSFQIASHSENYLIVCARVWP